MYNVDANSTHIIAEIITTLNELYSFYLYDVLYIIERYSQNSFNIHCFT